MNAVSVIFPYRLEGVWVFDDAGTSLVREPFISCADNILDVLTEHIPDAARTKFEAPWLLASSEASFVTGHTLVVDGGTTSGNSWSRMLQGGEALRERCQAAMRETTATS